MAQPSTLNSQQEAQLNELARVVLATDGNHVEPIFRQNNARYTPPTMVLAPPYRNRLRHRPSGYGAFLLPARPQSLFGFVFL